MTGFEPIFHDCQEKFGALDAEDDADLTIYTVDGDTIEANAVGIDLDDNICRHFTWEELEEDNVREAIEDEPVTFEEVMEDANLEIGEPFMMMNGILPWESVSNIELDTKGLFQ